MPSIHQRAFSLIWLCCDLSRTFGCLTLDYHYRINRFKESLTLCHIASRWPVNKYLLRGVRLILSRLSLDEVSVVQSGVADMDTWIQLTPTTDKSKTFVLEMPEAQVPGPWRLSWKALLYASPVLSFLRCHLLDIFRDRTLGKMELCLDLSQPLFWYILILNAKWWIRGCYCWKRED